MCKSILLSLFLAFSLFGAPQAIVFDFGGVMTGQPNRQAVISFLCDTFHLSSEEFEQVNQRKRLAIKEGATDVEFWMGFAQENGIILPIDWEEQFCNVMKEAIGVNQEMYALVNQLSHQNNISIAMLSNIDERLAKLIRGEFGDGHIPGNTFKNESVSGFF
ncbi:MAG: hypothetical protein S4CHLAM2_09790 [Chlamydiales bacterium]|nr:hypothetical protein [Chlamydiales bacterium]